MKKAEATALVWHNALVVELVDTRDLKSLALSVCGFESRPEYQKW